MGTANPSTAAEAAIIWGQIRQAARALQGLTAGLRIDWDKTGGDRAVLEQLAVECGGVYTEQSGAYRVVRSVVVAVGDLVVTVLDEQPATAAEAVAP